MSKDGSPGNDLITARMLWEAGPILWKKLAALFTKYLKEGGVPEEFKKDVIVPLFKRGDRYWAKNYRPVSLMSVGAKLIQRILYARVLEWDKQKERGLTGPYNFGSVKGRDRHMVLWVLNVVCAWKMGREGGSTIVALWDANNAYPSIWQDGVDWLMYKGGVRGRLWKILRDMERGLESQVRVNGNMIKIKRHERGANQGAVAPPHRWKFIMAEWLYECERREMGTEMGGERIPGLGYVDDMSTMTEEVSELINMKFQREVFGRKWGMEWKPAKDEYIVRGERKGAKKKEEDMRKTGMKTKKEVKVLGELIGWDPARCPGQVQAAYKKMKGAAKTLEWMIWRGSVVDADILERLFDAIVGSLAAAHLIHTRITKGEEKRIEAIIKAGMAKRFLGVGKRASATGAMIRVGWTSVMVGVWKARLAFYWRLRTAVGLVRRILDKTIERIEEKADVEFSGRVGFLKEVKEMLAETILPSQIVVFDTITHCVIA